MATLSRFTVDFENLEFTENEIEIKFHYWSPISEILETLVRLFSYEEKVIDIGCGIIPFPNSTHRIDWKTGLKIDLDFDKFPFKDNYFNFAYSRHTFEDIQNPNNAFNEMVRVSKKGYIETPSPLVECLTNIDCSGNFSEVLKGYLHHRYIVWSSVENNTIYFLPKYPLIQIIEFESNFSRKIKYLLNKYPIYWNNYYYYDIFNPPKIVIYRNGINMKLLDDYPKLLYSAIYSSINYTNHIFKYFDSLI
jgi:hypothetical protein